MKKLLIAILSLCCIACENDTEVQRTIDSTLLIPKSGLQTITYAADQPTVTYEVALYRSGYNEGSSTATLIVDEAALANYNTKQGTTYQLMPADCYSMPETTVHLTNSLFMRSVDVAFQTASIPEGDYLLPITVKSADNTPVNKNLQTVLIAVEKEPAE